MFARRYNVTAFYRREREQRIGEMQEKREKLRQQIARDKVGYCNIILIKLFIVPSRI